MKGRGKVWMGVASDPSLHPDNLFLCFSFKFIFYSWLFLAPFFPFDLRQSVGHNPLNLDGVWMEEAAQPVNRWFFIVCVLSGWDVATRLTLTTSGDVTAVRIFNMRYYFFIQDVVLL